VNGKTVNQYLNEGEAQLYNEWIANDRRVRAVLAQVRAVAAKATELIMSEAANTQAPTPGFIAS
jgi:hypothetical protein